MTQRVRLGELLVDAHIITREQLDEVLQRQTSDPRRLGILLVEAGLLTETEVTQILSQQLSVPWVSLYHVDFSRQLLNLVPQELAERYGVVPIFVRRVRGLGQTLYIAMDDPSDETAIAAVTEYSGLPVRTMIAPPSEIRAAIRAYYTSASLCPARATADSGQGPVERGAPVLTEAAQHAPSMVRAPSSPATAAPAERAGAEAPDQGPVVSTVQPDEHDEAQTPAAPPPAGANGLPTDGSPVGVGVAGSEFEPSERPTSVTVDVRRATLPEPRRGGAPRMITVTLLDGTEIKLPARATSADGEDLAPGERLTARDMVAALRAAVHGADASEILGDNPRWERLLAALLALLLRKHLVADWEFIEEYNRMGGE